MNTNSIVFEDTYTSNEINKWIELGLIPQNILDQNDSSALYRFISENLKYLYSHYFEDKSHLDCYVQLPPPEDWPKTFELQVIDKKTGKVVKTLNQMKVFELCEGVSLNVRAKEISKWEKETIDVKSLTKEQNEVLKTFVLDHGKNRSLSRKEIATFIKEIQKRKHKGKKYLQGGHLVEQKIKYPKANASKPLIEFPETQKKITESKIEVKAEGIRLTAPESNLEHALTKILYEKSQTRNPGAEDFYSGNETPSHADYGGQTRKVPIVRFKRTELYKTYLDRENYSGAEAEFIDNLLLQYASKKFLIKYDRIKKMDDGNVLTDRIEDFTSLIKIVHFYPNLTEEQKVMLDNGDQAIREEKEEIVIAFSPIYIDQIDTKFIAFPEDTIQKLRIAAGGHHKVTASMHTLMEWSMQSMSAKRFKQEINEENMIRLLNLENQKNRKKRLHDRLKKDIEAISNMGIITKSEKRANVAGGMKWIFHFNEHYE